MNRQVLESFLYARPEEFKVVSISDGEIVLKLFGETFVLYLNHELNEDQGFLKEFSIR